MGNVCGGEPVPPHLSDGVTPSENAGVSADAKRAADIEAAIMGPKERDPNSFAEVNSLRCKSFHLDIELDFEEKIIKGTCQYQFIAMAKGVKELVLDTRDIEVTGVKDQSSGKELQFQFDSPHEAFGSALRIQLKSPPKKGKLALIAIDFKTSKDCSAIQFLEPKQTAGKKHPYVFSQCQAIHARSLFPCQDTPSVKSTYTATVTVPKPLTALMSAVMKEDETVDSEDGKKRTFSFEQAIPIPSYLTAIAAGDLVFRDIGPRSRVWSEPSMVDAGAFEFADTEKFVKTGEELLGDYVWGRYDILLLPPSFCYGGMENPCLTFVTPTLIAGDRSLANVVAHEIAHSWTGNLVTNVTWEHFWLNEGFTVFVERKIIGRLSGTPHFGFQASIGYKDLKDSVDGYGHDSPMTNLNVKLEGIDPDDAFSSIPYEKGFNLLYFIETLVGGPEVMDQFLKSYIQKFSYCSITTDDFRSYLYEYFNDKKEKLDKEIDWDAWLHTPGMPPVSNTFDPTLADAADKLAQRWISGSTDFSGDDLKKMSSGQVVYFFNKLLEAEALADPKGICQNLENVYKMNQYKNSEIRFRWHMLCIRSNYKPILPAVTEFLKEQGRMKFVRPLFKALFNSTMGKDHAIDLFKSHGSQYHPVAHKMLAHDLGLEE